jgi:hypothetical protein
MSFSDFLNNIELSFDGRLIIDFAGRIACISLPRDDWEEMVCRYIAKMIREGAPF